jgi:hypothetical protein
MSGASYVSPSSKPLAFFIPPAGRDSKSIVEDVKMTSDDEQRRATKKRK